LDSIFYNIFFA
jgi:hypothetical protein